MIVGITGGIGTGKSTVSNYLIEKGYNIIDADKISREIIKYIQIKKAIVQKFGNQILEDPLNKDSNISRNKLRKIVFNDKENTIKINEIMHPKIIEEMKRQIDLQKTSKLIFVDVPLLFETNLEYLFDKILLVYANQEAQIKRVMERDNKNREETVKIIKSQLDIEEKKRKSDYVIENMSTIEDLKVKIDKILKIFDNINDSNK